MATIKSSSTQKSVPSGNTSSCLQTNKTALRLEVKRWLSELTAEEWYAKSNMALQNLNLIIQHPEFRRFYPGRYFLYASHKTEIPTLNLIQHGLNDKTRELFLPRIHHDDLEMIKIASWRDVTLNEKYDIFEPLSINDAQTETQKHFSWGLVPGVLFNHLGLRLGRGGGFYDKFLSRVPTQCLTIGIGFKVPTKTTIPQEKWDVPVNVVVHDQGIELANVSKHPFFTGFQKEKQYNAGIC